MISLEEIMDPDDVAELLHLKRSTVIDYARRGVLPGKKLGKHWLFLRSELDDTIHQLRGALPRRLTTAGSDNTYDVDRPQWRYG